MTKDQFTPLEIKFGENEVGAVVKLSWEYSGQSQTIVPSSYYYNPEYVGSSPYTVTVTCPDGYSASTAGNPTN